MDRDQDLIPSLLPQERILSFFKFWYCVQNVFYFGKSWNSCCRPNILICFSLLYKDLKPTDILWSTLIFIQVPRMTRIQNSLLNAKFKDRRRAQWYKNWKHKEVLYLYLFYFLLRSSWDGRVYFVEGTNRFLKYFHLLVKNHSFLHLDTIFEQSSSTHVPQHHGAHRLLEKGGDSVSPLMRDIVNWVKGVPASCLQP